MNAFSVCCEMEIREGKAGISNISEIVTDKRGRNPRVLLKAKMILCFFVSYFTRTQTSFKQYSRRVYVWRTRKIDPQSKLFAKFYFCKAHAMSSIFVFATVLQISIAALLQPEICQR